MFRANIAAGYGGAFGQNSGRVMIADSDFEYNEGNLAGGAIYVYSNVDFGAVRCVFSDNHAVSRANAVWRGGIGGAIASSLATAVSVAASTFSNNGAVTGGGAIGIYIIGSG